MRSPVWNYFDLVTDDETKAVCRICQTIVSRGSKYSTSCLLSHLRYKHDLEQKAGEESLADMERLAQLMDKDFLSNAIRSNDPRIELVARGGNVKSPVWRTFLVIMFNGKKTMHIACNMCHQVYRYDSHHMGTSNLYRHKCVHIKLNDSATPNGSLAHPNDGSGPLTSGDPGSSEIKPGTPYRLTQGLTTSSTNIKGEGNEDDGNVTDPTLPFSPLVSSSNNLSFLGQAQADAKNDPGAQRDEDSYWQVNTSRQREQRNYKRRVNYYNRRTLSQLVNTFKRPSLTTNLSLQRALGQSMLLQQMRALSENGKLNLAEPANSDLSGTSSQGDALDSDNPFTYLASLDAETEEFDEVPSVLSEPCDDNFVDDSLSDIDKSFKFWRKITNLGLLPGFIDEVKKSLDEMQVCMMHRNAYSEDSNQYGQIVDYTRRLSYVVTELRLTPRLKEKLARHQTSIMLEQEKNRLELISLKRKLEMQEMRQEELHRKTQCFDDLMKQQDILLDDPEKFKDPNPDLKGLRDYDQSVDVDSQRQPEPFEPCQASSIPCPIKRESEGLNGISELNHNARALDDSDYSVEVIEKLFNKPDDNLNLRKPFGYTPEQRHMDAGDNNGLPNDGAYPERVSIMAPTYFSIENECDQLMTDDPTPFKDSIPDNIFQVTYNNT